MAAGDMVLQPPGIRHRVLEASPGLEVVEISCPAIHETFAELALSLPNGEGAPGRSWEGQTFFHHVAAAAPWCRWHGGEAQETGLGAAMGGRAEARLLRPGVGPGIAIPPHDGELVFGFVLEGTARLDYEGRHALGPADAFVIPPDGSWGLAELSADFRLLHVATRALE
jgi:quercetin dioxygenase-like cupin family protein